MLFHSLLKGSFIFLKSERPREKMALREKSEENSRAHLIHMNEKVDVYKSRDFSGAKQACLLTEESWKKIAQLFI